MAAGEAAVVAAGLDGALDVAGTLALGALDPEQPVIMNAQTRSRVNGMSNFFTDLLLIVVYLFF